MDAPSRLLSMLVGTVLVLAGIMAAPEQAQVVFWAMGLVCAGLMVVSLFWPWYGHGWWVPSLALPCGVLALCNLLVALGIRQYLDTPIR